MNSRKMKNIDTIVETRQGSIKIVKYNKPKKKNAIDVDMYCRVTRILHDAAADGDISLLVLTGTGEYYSSGNDLLSSAEMMGSSSRENSMASVLKNYIDAFIRFPKILVAIVNGPAIGIAATTLALCDLVFASENSFFYTPFSKLGLVAEGCSTFTFPKLIGDRKAAEMLLYNHRMSAKEAVQCGFVNYVYRPEELQSKVWDKIVEVSKLPQSSLTITKKLLRRNIQDEMIRANESEIEALNKVWTSDEYLSSILSFVNKKSKV